jgi:hypothetical protein
VGRTSQPRAGGGGGYFDETESTIGSDDVAERRPNARQTYRNRITPADQQDQQSEVHQHGAYRRTPGKLERAAAECIAAVIVEELSQIRSGGRGHGDDQSVREASARAALRLVQSATTFSEGNEKVLPLEAFGDRKVLAEWVASTQVIM